MVVGKGTSIEAVAEIRFGGPAVNIVWAPRGFGAAHVGGGAVVGDDRVHAQDRGPVGHATQHRGGRRHRGIGSAPGGQRKRAPAAAPRHHGAMVDVRVHGAAKADGPWQLAASFVVAADHAVLAGHFPGRPLVPGVLLLEAVRLAWQQAAAAAAELVAVPEARWLRPVPPGAEVELRAAVAPDPAGVRVEGECTLAAQRVASFAVVLRPAGGAAGPRTPPRS